MGKLNNDFIKKYYKKIPQIAVELNVSLQWLYSNIDKIKDVKGVTPGIKIKYYSPKEIELIKEYTKDRRKPNKPRKYKIFDEKELENYILQANVENEYPGIKAQYLSSYVEKDLITRYKLAANSKLNYYLKSELDSKISTIKKKVGQRGPGKKKKEQKMLKEKYFTLTQLAAHLKTSKQNLHQKINNKSLVPDIVKNSKSIKKYYFKKTRF